MRRNLLFALLLVSLTTAGCYSSYLRRLGTNYQSYSFSVQANLPKHGLRVESASIRFPEVPYRQEMTVLGNRVYGQVNFQTRVFPTNAQLDVLTDQGTASKTLLLIPGNATLNFGSL